MRQRPPTQRQKLKAIIEFGGVAAIFLNDREQLRQVIAKQPRSQHGLTRVHPVLVPPQRVDFAIVNQVAIGVRTSPTRKGIRTEARMHHGDGGFDQRIGKIRIEGGDLPCRQHALIDDRLAGQTRNVEIFADGLFPVTEGVLRTSSDDVQFALEGHVILDSLAAADENLSDERLARFRCLSKIKVICRYLTPSEKTLPLAGDNLLKHPFTPMALIPIGQKDHAHPILPRFGQAESQSIAGVLEKGVRDLEQDTGAVAGILLAATCAAVVQILQNRQCLLDDPMGLFALDINNEADATSIVLEFGVIKSLFGRETGLCHASILLLVF